MLKISLPTVPDPIFIVGSPRSGTTLLQCMLNASRDTYSLPETHYFCTVLPAAGIKAEATLNQDQFEVITRTLAKKMDLTWPRGIHEMVTAGIERQELTAGDLFQILLNSYKPTDLESKSLRVIEKTPYHIFFLEDLLALFPDARFVHLIRDPRGVVSSRLKMPGGNPDALTEYSLDWVRCIKAGEFFSETHPGVLYPVRYEDLINRPEDCLQELCAFLDLPFQTEMISDFASQFHGCTLASESSWKGGVREGKLLDRQEIWKKYLSPDQAAQIVERCQPQMSQYGYLSKKDAKMKATELSPNLIQTVFDQSNQNMAAFKDKHRGERCVIIGNGPSLNEMDLSFLKDEVTFGLNRIYLGFDQWDFRPTYFVSVNSLVLEQHADEILDQIKGPKFLSQHGLPYFPHDQEDVMFLRSLDEPIFSKDPRGGIWEGYTVTYVALQLAYFMGFSEVLLIGVDHNFVTKGPANAEVTSEGSDPNHFAKDYFGKGKRWHLPDLHNSEMAYSLAGLVYQEDGRRILDGTVKGKLTLFPKTDYKTYLSSSVGSAQDSTADQEDKPLVSAIVSTYNDADLLPGCLDDLENQTIADQLEIIVIDSGSQENEAEIIREYQARYDNIVYLRTERESLYDAWNRGVFLARGKYITNANTDDGHRPDALEILADALEGNPQADLAYAHCAWTSRPNDRFQDSKAYREVYYPPYDPEKAMFYCLLGPHPVWRRDVFKKIGIFDNRFRAAGDFDFQFRFTAAGLKAVLVPEILSLFYQNPTGLTLEDDTSNNEAIQIYNKYRSQIPITSLYDIQGSSKDGEAAAWTALGNRAIRFQPPWEDLPQQDLAYAIYCYQRGLTVNPHYYPAFHNLVTVLSSVGNWKDAAEILQQGSFHNCPELEQAVRQHRLLPLEKAQAPRKVEPLVYERPEDVADHNQLAWTADEQPPEIAAQFGFNVVGYISGRIGLGVTVRNVIQALVDRGYPVSGFDLKLEDGRGGADLGELETLLCSKPSELKYAVNLYVVPPPTIGWLHEEITRAQGNQPRLNVAWSMWELPVIPEDWVPDLEAMDLLIAESEFIRYAFDFNLSGVRSITAKHPLFMPDDIYADRKRFGLPDNGILYLTSFEPLSDPRRKNPGGVIKAFLNAVGNESDAHLVVKINHGSQGGVTHPLAEPLVKECQAHPRIHLIDESLSYPDVLTLYKSCDVIVSLHRSEGLGLVPLEGMRLGKPVIATAWSGNMTYMNYGNSCPVKYRLIKAHGSLPQYQQNTLGPDAVWADPCPHDAALWMRRLYESPSLRSSLGGRAAAEMAVFQEEAVQSQFITDIFNLWKHRKAASLIDHHLTSASKSGHETPGNVQTPHEAPNPEETLKQILEADDILAALESNQPKLDSSLLALVEDNIEHARTSGEDDLAEGLEHLAGYIAGVLN